MCVYVRLGIDTDREYGMMESPDRHRIRQMREQRRKI